MRFTGVKVLVMVLQGRKSSRASEKQVKTRGPDLPTDGPEVNTRGPDLPTDGPDHTTRPKGHHSGQE